MGGCCHSAWVCPDCMHDPSLLQKYGTDTLLREDICTVCHGFALYHANCPMIAFTSLLCMALLRCSWYGFLTSEALATKKHVLVND